MAKYCRSCHNKLEPSAGRGKVKRPATLALLKALLNAIK